MLRKNQSNSPSGMSFNNDGTKMFVIGYNGDYVLEYDLTTGFDINTASHAGAERSLLATITGTTGGTFNSHGTKMYLLVQIMMR